MTARRILTVATVAGGVPLLLSALIAAPAQAHGALQDPVSRVAACGSQGTRQQVASKACQAALAASGTDAFEDWDNLRVAGVAGRDRQVIPDGKLCSGGIARYKGLDLPRADWPSTRLSAGAQFTFRYRETIPHEGTFRLYVTNDSYRPTQPLTWSDLETKPFLTVTDPELRNSSYVLKGRLPQGRSGRQLIYTIWQNSSTPDTYYSCSDVVFGGADPAAAQPRASRRPASAGRSAAAGQPPPSAQPVAGQSQAGFGAARSVSAVRSDGGGMPLAAGLAAGAALLATAIAAVVLRRRRRPNA